VRHGAPPDAGFGLFPRHETQQRPITRWTTHQRGFTFCLLSLENHPMNFFSTICTTGPSLVRPCPPSTGPPRPLLLVVEGRNDLEFLLRVARLLYRDQAIVADLAMLLASHYVVALPLGGEVTLDWADRLAPLDCPGFYLFDRELEPQTGYRQQLVQRLSDRPHCCARLTSKRSLENFLHPAAVAAAGGDRISFGDDDDVAALLVAPRPLQCVHTS
jgi:hypothetical protein